MQNLRKKLEAIPAQMAEDVKPFIEGASMNGYKKFLNSMYHYTKSSGDRLRYSTIKANDSKAKELFKELAEEEDPHFKLAIADLENLGLEVDENLIPLVEEFHDFWMTREKDEEWLGILLALEGVGAFVGDYAKMNLARLGINHNQANFILEHLEADEEHGEKTMQLCEKYENSTALWNAAKYASDFWVKLHKDALDL